LPSNDDQLIVQFSQLNFEHSGLQNCCLKRAGKNVELSVTQPGISRFVEIWQADALCIIGAGLVMKAENDLQSQVPVATFLALIIFR